MDDIIRIIKSLENVDLLIVVGGVSQTEKHEIIKKEGGFLGMLLGNLEYSIRCHAFKGVMRTEKGYNAMNNMSKSFYFCSIL